MLNYLTERIPRKVRRSRICKATKSAHQHTGEYKMLSVPSIRAALCACQKRLWHEYQCRSCKQFFRDGSLAALWSDAGCDACNGKLKV